MAKMVMTGVDEYIKKLQRIGRTEYVVSTIKYAVYPGAGIVADAIRTEIEANHRESGDLADSMVIVPMRNDNGYINTKVNFDGYDQKGVPNAVKVAALESGNSRGQKATHFLSKTVRRVRAAAEKAMADALDEKINQIMEG